MTLREIRELLGRGSGTEAVPRLARRLARRDPILSHAVRLAKRLWAGGRREERALAVHLLGELHRHFRPDHWVLFKAWLRGDPSQCDLIAGRLFGPLVETDRSWIRVLRHWTRDSGAWIRRAAILSVLARVRRMGDIDAGLFVTAPLLGDSDPRVLEAVRRVLEECREVDPASTEAYLREAGSSSRRRGRRL